MKFMMIMQCKKSDFESLAAWTPAEFRAHIAFMTELNDQLRASGEFVLAEGLDTPSNAKIVTALDARAPIVTDGPFAETKEFLAGFWIVECVSLERAIAIAAKASTAPGRGGKPFGIPIELRQVMPAPELG